MKALLMHRDRDFDRRREPPPNSRDLELDLELGILFEAMAAGDPFLLDVSRRAVLASLDDPDEIVYRQDVLRDCLAQSSTVRELYDLAVDTIEQERKNYFGIFTRSPELVLHRSVEVLQMFAGRLRTLRRIGDERAAAFRSEGFSKLFRTLAAELDDGYLAAVDEHVRRLRFRRGVLISAELGRGAKGTRYVLRKPWKQGWLDRIPLGDRAGFNFRVADRDEAGQRALSELQGRGLNLAANALAQSNEHILGFFDMLRTELGFYIGCLNLHERLAGKAEPTCFPVPTAPGRPALSGRGLYDVCLSLNLPDRVVGNDVAADGRSLVVVTGANQGGKSTFLRSVGLAQLMMQCGMFVPAEECRADVRDGLFTHFRREEDDAMESGKLDEELRRMSDIADAMGPNGVLLCNESFASTNEREGSEIARQIVRALLEAGVKVLLVTHLFELAGGLYAQELETALFLRAERQNGRRTFRLVEGAPQPTSHGEDVYRRVFGRAVRSGPVARQT